MLNHAVFIDRGRYAIVGFGRRFRLLTQFFIRRQLFFSKWCILLVFVQLRDLHGILNVFRRFKRCPAMEYAAQRIKVFKAHQRHFFFNFTADFLYRFQPGLAEEFNEVIRTVDPHLLPVFLRQNMRKHVVCIDRGVNDWRCSQENRSAPAILFHQVRVFDCHIPRRLRHRAGGQIGQL